MQWNAATECKDMLPLAVFPGQHYAAAQCHGILPSLAV